MADGSDGSRALGVSTTDVAACGVDGTDGLFAAATANGSRALGVSTTDVSVYGVDGTDDLFAAASGFSDTTASARSSKGC